MAKRKTAGTARRKTATRRTAAAPARARTKARTAARKSAKARKRSGRASASSARSSPRRAGKRKTAAGRTRTTRAAAPRKAAGTRKAVSKRQATPRRAKSAATASRPARAMTRKPVKARRPRAIAATTVIRKAPALDRARRRVTDEDIVPTPPSSLDLDRSASSMRSGRRELKERFDEHTETGPAITGGDVDADWESAYTVGDEAPGGDNPTPDQDIVDDIGRAVGVEYQDNEELKGDEKIAKRDKHRWELDPASSEDYEDR